MLSAGDLTPSLASRAQGCPDPPPDHEALLEAGLPPQALIFVYLKFKSAISSLLPSPTIPTEVSGALPWGWASGLSFVCPISPGNKTGPSADPQTALILTVLHPETPLSFAFGDPFLFSIQVSDDASSVSDFFLLNTQSPGTCLFHFSAAALTSSLPWVALPKDETLEAGSRCPLPCSPTFLPTWM